VIDVGEPFATAAAAGEWLASAGEQQLEAGLAILNRALLAQRALTADPYLSPVSRRQTLVARVGYGAGDEVAEGRWRQAVELMPPESRWMRSRRKRERLVSSQASLAVALSGRRVPLLSEELALRARLDLDLGHTRAAALQLEIAVDAAVVELAQDSTTPGRSGHLEPLRDASEDVRATARAALSGEVSADQSAQLERTLSLLERALRAHAAALSDR
jgi:hypothetical protein